MRAVSSTEACNVSVLKVQGLHLSDLFWSWVSREISQGPKCTSQIWKCALTGLRFLPLDSADFCEAGTRDEHWESLCGRLLFDVTGIMTGSRGFEKSELYSVFFWAYVLRFSFSLSSHEGFPRYCHGEQQDSWETKLSPFFIIYLEKSNRLIMFRVLDKKIWVSKGMQIPGLKYEFLSWHSFRLSKTQASAAQSNGQFIWQCQKSIDKT